MDKKIKTKVVEKEEVIKTKKVDKEKNIETTKNVKQEKEPNLVVSLLELAAIIIFVVVVIVFFPNTIVWNIVVLLLILTVLVAVHEFGHFIVAKLCGVHVYEYSIGMGPRLFYFKRKNDPTEYSVRLLPIGGYCKMAGEEGEDDSSLPKDKFMCNQSKIKRILILVAGVTLNFVLAFVILFFISLICGSAEQNTYIGTVQQDSPAQIAGIVPGDKIVSLNGYKVSNWDKLSIVTALKNDGVLHYTIQHKDGSKTTYDIVPAEYVAVGEDYVKVTKENTVEKIIKDNKLLKETEPVKLVGISSQGEIKHGFVNAIKYAFNKLVGIVDIMLLTVISLITGKLGLNSLSGPVGMYTIVGQAATYGLANIIYLAAYLSINLGVINILPFPAFDGGRVVFVIIEAITRKKVNPNVEGAFHMIGFILLMILMLFITFQDILRLF